MASRKKTENIDSQELVTYIVRMFNLNPQHWEFELIISHNWLGIKIRKTHPSRVFESSIRYTTQKDLKHKLLTVVKTGLTELQDLKGE